jgi:exopolysaccharide biosynthesis polyprenyl glycosylphosphotransferase
LTAGNLVREKHDLVRDDAGENRGNVRDGEMTLTVEAPAVEVAGREVDRERGTAVETGTSSLGFPRTNPRTWERRYVAAAVTSDLLVAGVAGVVAFAVRFGSQPSTAAAHFALSLALPLLWVSAIGLAGGYQRRHLGLGHEEFNRVLVGALGVIAAVGVVSWAANWQIARGYVVVALPLAATLSLAGRYVLRKHIHRERTRGRFLHRAIALGHRRGVASLMEHLGRSAHHGYVVVGACVPERDAHDGPIGDVPVAGTFDNVVASVEASGSDTVLVVPTSELDGDALRRLSWDLAHTGASVVVAPGLIDVVGPRMAMRPVQGLPLLQVEQPAFGGIKRLVKQSYDPVVAALALVLLSPLFLAIGLAIKLDSKGPVFFRQSRVGRLGDVFTIVKFRTMVVDAEARKNDISHLNEGAGPLFKMRQDPRVTRVGALLRKTSLDELPQLLNVLMGHMSLVGPRPHLQSEIDAFGEDFRRRLLVKPGMTGLWQVSGRSDLAFDEAIRVDLRYVENWSLALDAYIVWKTVGVVVRGSGAY